MGDWTDAGVALGRCRVVDGPDYWEHLEARHREHRRSVRILLAFCAIVGVAAVTVHPGVLVIGIVLVPLLLIEWWAARHSRPIRSRSAP